MALPGPTVQCVSLGEGGHVLWLVCGLSGESPQCANLEQVVSRMGMDVRCMGMSMVGSCCVPDLVGDCLCLCSLC